MNTKKETALVRQFARYCIYPLLREQKSEIVWGRSLFTDVIENGISIKAVTGKRFVEADWLKLFEAHPMHADVLFGNGVLGFGSRITSPFPPGYEIVRLHVKMPNDKELEKIMRDMILFEKEKKHA